MIEASQRMIRINSQGGEEGKEGGDMNPAINRHLELEIKTLLQNAPRRDADKLERFLKVKEREKEDAIHIEDTHRKVGYRN
jgi:hypothetical protein